MNGFDKVLANIYVNSRATSPASEYLNFHDKYDILFFENFQLSQNGNKFSYKSPVNYAYGDAIYCNIECSNPKILLESVNTINSRDIHKYFKNVKVTYKLPNDVEKTIYYNFEK